MSVLIVAVMIVTFCSCGRDSLNSVSDTGSKVAVSSSHQNDVKPPLDPKTVKPDPYQIKPETAVQTQFVQQNEAFSLKGLAYQIQSISVSKKLTGFQRKNIEYHQETADQSGTLTSEHSYVFIEFKIKNMHPEKASVYLNNFKIVSIEENNLVNLKMGSELLAFDKSQHKNSTHEYFKFEFQPNEEATFHFVYIVPDAALKNNLCLLINPTGAYGSGDNYNPDEKKYVKLEIS